MGKNMTWRLFGHHFGEFQLQNSMKDIVANNTALRKGIGNYSVQAKTDI